MAKLAELGKNYPCVSQGILIPPSDEETEFYPGDVLEAQFIADKDISIDAAFNCLHEILRMKEQYPDFVLHYVKVETRQIIVQYSVAPIGGSIPISRAITSHGSRAIASPGIWLIVAVVAALAAIIVGATAAIIAFQRGYLLPVKPPTGNAVITAKHTETKKGIPGVRIYVDGDYVGKTDGGSVSIENLLTGNHQFAGETIEEFHAPAPVTATIIRDQTIDITIWYRPIDIPEPETGYLHVYTTPVTGVVYIDGAEKGPAPLSIELSIGNHTVGFAPVEGYLTPPVQTVTIVGGETATITGNYRLPDEDEEWYEKILRYALIGGGVIIGGALILPPAIRAIGKSIHRRQEEK